MKIWHKIKHKFAKWIWKNNDWTKVVDDIESAAITVNRGDCKEVILHWHLQYLSEPNWFEIKVSKIKELQND